MAKKPIIILKEYFEAGKRPTESQFEDLIDSYVHVDSFNPSIYLPLSGGTMTGSLTLNSSVGATINRNMSTITAAGGFARNFTQLIGTNGITDIYGHFGSIDNSGNITLTYGFLGGTTYNGKNALRWTSDQRVTIGASSGVLPTAGYALDIIGNEYVRGNVVFAGSLHTYQGELAIQRQGTNRIRTSSTQLILSGDTQAGIIYLRPQGDLISTGQIVINSANTQYVDNYTLLFGSQTVAGSSVFHTNLSNSVQGYGIWFGHNLQFNGTDFVQPRGSLASLGFTVNYHKGFSFNIANASGINGSVVPLIELVKISSTGIISTASTGSSDQWNTAFGWGNHLGKYFSVDYTKPINALIYENDMLTTPLGTYAATVSAASANLPFAQAGGLISFGDTLVSTKILGARDNSDNLWFQSGNSSGAWRQLASREWVLAQLNAKTSGATGEIIDNTFVSAQFKEIGIKKEYKIPDSFYLELTDDTSFITVIGDQSTEMICNILKVYQKQEVTILNLSDSSVIKVQFDGRVIALVESLKHFKIYITTDLRIIDLGKSDITVLA